MMQHRIHASLIVVLMLSLIVLPSASAATTTYVDYVLDQYDEAGELLDDEAQVTYQQNDISHVIINSTAIAVHYMDAFAFAETPVTAVYMIMCFVALCDADETDASMSYFMFADAGMLAVVNGTNATDGMEVYDDYFIVAGDFVAQYFFMMSVAYSYAATMLCFDLYPEVDELTEMLEEIGVDPDTIEELEDVLDITDMPSEANANPNFDETSGGEALLNGLANAWDYLARWDWTTTLLVLAVALLITILAMQANKRR